MAVAALAATSARAEGTRHPPCLARPSHSAAMAHSPGANAPPVPGGSSAALAALLADWDRAGFSAPSKPAQFRVYGRKGYVTSGPGYNAIVSLIGSALRDSREGRDQEALAKIAKVRRLLDR